MLPPPPTSQLAVPPTPPNLLSITLDELARAQLCPPPSATNAYAPHTAIDASLIAVALLCGGGEPAGTEAGLEQQQQQQQQADTQSSPLSVPALEMENAKLRMELASHIAAACARELMASQQAQAAAVHQQLPPQQPLQSGLAGGVSIWRPSIGFSQTDIRGAGQATAAAAAADLPVRTSGSQEQERERSPRMDHEAEGREEEAAEAGAIQVEGTTAEKQPKEAAAGLTGPLIDQKVGLGQRVFPEILWLKSQLSFVNPDA